MSTYGKNLILSIFGESHGPAIGAVLDGLPAGEEIDEQALAEFLKKRSPGRDASMTARKEKDQPRFLSGLYRGKTTGTPLAFVMDNTDTRSQDYAETSEKFRPGHADYTGFVRYGGFADPRGGGHFSGRLTAPLVAAGGICKQILARRGVEIAGHIFSIAGIGDAPLNAVNVTKQQLSSLQASDFPLVDPALETKMRAAIAEAAAERNSVGGCVECIAVGLPAGIGSPMFSGLENRIAQLAFGIPAVKGIEFGSGFGVCAMTGAQCNDEFYSDDGKILTRTNHNGGILGGISNGMPLIFRLAVKPTPSIAAEQHTVTRRGEEALLAVNGRHDPCIVPRAVPCAESALAVALLDAMLERGLPAAN